MVMVVIAVVPVLLWLAGARPLLVQPVAVLAVVPVMAAAKELLRWPSTKGPQLLPPRPLVPVAVAVGVSGKRPVARLRLALSSLADASVAPAIARVACARRTSVVVFLPARAMPANA